MDDNKFLEIIDATPLVSIDIILRNSEGKILLGRRENKPAQGSWFVPGGRIRKNESLNDAMARISNTELGVGLELGTAKLIGAFDHIYEDNFTGQGNIGTHYVALGYELKLLGDPEIKGDTQHKAMKWWDLNNLLGSSEVHENTKAYFR